MAYTIFINIILILSGEEIIHEVKKYTGDLRTGFGSFIEKNLAPFSSAYPENNCRKKDIKCDQPYSFIHKVNMIWCKYGLGLILRTIYWLNNLLNIYQIQFIRQNPCRQIYQTWRPMSSGKMYSLQLLVGIPTFLSRH